MNYIHPDLELESGELWQFCEVSQQDRYEETLQMVIFIFDQ